MRFLGGVPRDSARNWVAAASSADGTKLVAAVDGGRIYTSTDSGATWISQESDRAWYAVASSADGTKLVAGVGLGGRIYTSALPSLSGARNTYAELLYIGNNQYVLVNQQGVLNFNN